MEKLEWCGYPMVKKKFVCRFTQYRCVTDRLTSCDSIVRAMHKHRTVKTV